MWFEDLQPWDYLPVEADVPILAVGWLDEGNPFATREPDEQVHAAMDILFQRDESRMMLKYDTSCWAAGGSHPCYFCNQGQQAPRRTGPRGYSNLFIRSEREIFVCPDLIKHYIEVHRYAPPKQFINALLKNPPPVIFNQRAVDAMVEHVKSLRGKA